jgi:hypothetical protein
MGSVDAHAHAHTYGVMECRAVLIQTDSCLYLSIYAEVLFCLLLVVVDTYPFSFDDDDDDDDADGMWS